MTQQNESASVAHSLKADYASNRCASKLRNDDLWDEV
jgi:hypothetical protein